MLIYRHGIIRVQESIVGSSYMQSIKIVLRFIKTKWHKSICIATAYSGSLDPAHFSYDIGRLCLRKEIKVIHKRDFGA